MQRPHATPYLLLTGCVAAEGADEWDTGGALPEVVAADPTARAEEAEEAEQRARREAERAERERQRVEAAEEAERQQAAQMAAHTLGCMHVCRS